MRNRLLLAATVLGFGLATASFFVGRSDAAQGDGKNLQVLPKTLSKKEIRAIMKEISKGVGRSCDECHDLDDFAADSDLKKKAREMFKLTDSINARLKKDGFEKRVKCVTCHAGAPEPK